LVKSLQSPNYVLQFLDLDFNAALMQKDIQFS